MVNPPKDALLQFLRKEQISNDTYSFYFDNSSRIIDFIPGQYIRMTLPIDQPDERGKTRLFTIASSPLEKDHIMITTKIMQSTFKKTLVQLVPGTQVQFFGPMGIFTLREEETMPRIFIAGGIGITPFHSMITYVYQKKLPIPITLFVSFSTPEEVIFKDELETISKQMPTIKVIYTVTKPEGSTMQWNGETGRISKDLMSKYTEDLRYSIYYLVGPPVMVSAMLELVQQIQVPPEQVRRENFVGY